ncbi:aminopeptidase N [Alcanivorax sp. N3-2A]|nr:aminopeptidase N [Alcanivorax sp. N3-2A]|tara:strand:- start:19841 stop:22477 length:2637 start_codon:yes stop_codon:yes gene_type:complete
MRDGNPAAVTRLADYQPPAYLVEHTRLDVDIHDGHTVVSTELQLVRNPARQDQPEELVLNGDHLRLEALNLDGRALKQSEYQLQGGRLTIAGLPERCLLSTRVRIEPENNTALEGLYRSNGMYCTQCEAEGFRRITFFPDRPDVLSRFTTTVHADQQRYPLLLSNGNPVARGEEEGGRHFVTWEDPFPKPCYLFALVAGDLACLEDTFTTASGREIALRLYAEHRDLDKLDHAMDSLKRAMAWDEQVYGREYDLDLFQIVAVSHFNMGAMENKGLNIFNTSCVLAHPATTTDAAFERVESVVAHEYFHNWSGNRVTCRDWFQLSLKEGFTVFRDQEFSSDMNSRTVVRVENVDFLINHQFPEDQGPMAHPVRPAEYQKIDNFYTLTIYEKGSEIVRMQRQLLGADDFRRATDLYFQRFDGQAVTCDDFVACMEEISGQDLSQFKRWYSQAGTPVVTVEDAFEPAQGQGEYRLTLRQHTPATPGQPDKQPLMIPVRLALLDDQGQALPLNDAGDVETVVTLGEAEQTFNFPARARPVPSLLRGFSAPVELRYPFQEAQLHVLLAFDTDGFCRWDAAQRLYFMALAEMIDHPGSSAAQVARLRPVLEQVIERAGEDPAEAALLLTLPTETAVGDRHSPLDPQPVHAAVSGLRAALGEALAEHWWRLAETLYEPRYRADGDAMGKRRLRQLALGYLASAAGAGLIETDQITAHLQRSLDHPTCMTEELGALRALVHNDLDGANQALRAFEARWHDEALVIDQWFAVQATVPGADTVARARALLDHPAFEWTLPNRVRALIGTLVNGNPSAFHAADGSGYRLFATALKKLDGINPQIAARLANGAARLERLAPPLQQPLRDALQTVRDGASANLAEVLDRIL